jgi:hypothetical protein
MSAHADKALGLLQRPSFREVPTASGTSQERLASPWLYRAPTHDPLKARLSDGQSINAPYLKANIASKVVG